MRGTWLLRAACFMAIFGITMILVLPACSSENETLQLGQQLEGTNVDIDIKPGSDVNTINCTNDLGVVPVAILTTDDFDATTVDHTTVTFEGASETHVNKKTGMARRHQEDVDDDGDTDLVFHFHLGETNLTCRSLEGTLVGETFDGQAIEGTDSVVMVGTIKPTGVPGVWNQSNWNEADWQ